MREIQSQSRAEQHSCHVIGQMDNSIDHTFESANRVYDDMGVAPTVNTCGGGGLQPKVVEVKKMNVKQLGFIENGTGKHQSNTVYGTDGVCTKITTINGGGTQQIKIIDTQIVEMRVRNPENPSDRTAGIKTEQRLEPNNVNYTNTLTSVQKDNLVLEADIINTLKDVEGVGWHFAQNVYSEDSPCIRSIKSGEGSGNIPKIIKIRQATKDGFIECELPGVADLNYPSSETRRGRVQDGGKVSPTLTTENIPSVLELADPDFYNFLYEIDGEIYLIRIRKLIPLECWRLMDFNEGSFEKAQEVNSNTQLYKQAGNSIVVNCLVAIFGQMFEGKEDIYKQINLRK